MDKNRTAHCKFESEDHRKLDSRFCVGAELIMVL